MIGSINQLVLIFSYYGIANLYVYMHTTEDVPYINTPQESKNMVILGTNLKVAFKVTEIENDPKLKSLSVEQRKCRFPLENNLKVYKYYSYSGCVVNCRTEAQIKLCNCTHHLLPKIHNFETCTISGLTCLSKNAKTIGSIKAIDSNKPGLVCSCIPSCTEHDHQTVEKIQTSYEDKSYSLIRIYMTSLPTIRFQRYIVRTNLDLVVSLGGTAGLFLGASLLSIAELFDFMLLRRLHKHLTRSADGNNLRNVAENKNINDAFLNKTTHNCKVKPIFVHYLP